MAINWTAVQTDVEAEIESLKDARAQDATALLIPGLSSYVTKIQGYVADEAAAITSLSGLCTALASHLTTNGDLPTAEELGDLIPSADLTLIEGVLEDEYETAASDSVTEVVSPKYPDIEAT